MPKRYTTETFKQKLLEKGRTDLELIEEYGNNNREKILFKCTICENEWFAAPADILSGRKCPKCAKKQSVIKRRKTNEQFLKEFKDKGNANIEILESYKTYFSYLRVRCKKDSSHIWEMRPQDILKGGGCPYCSHKKISVDGSNSLAIDRPDLLQYFLNEEDAFKYSTYSNKKLYFKCPECGKIKTKKMIIGNLSKRGFSCEFCGDKISKPNKFIREVAIQLLELKEIDKFRLEYSPEWAKPYRYDCYILKDKQNILLELDGIQHKKDKGIYSLGVSERDKIKNQLAKKNNYILVRIDCENTDFGNLKNQLLRSEIVDFIKFDKIDWESIKINMQKNLTKEICDEYNKYDYISTTTLAKKFHICKETAAKSLKIGKELNWCDYNAKIDFAKEKRFRLGKKINIYNLNNDLIQCFDTKKEAKEWIKKQEGSCSICYINDCLSGKRSSYKNYIFKYHNPQTTKQNNQK